MFGNQSIITFRCIHRMMVKYVKEVGGIALSFIIILLKGHYEIQAII